MSTMTRTRAVRKSSFTILAAAAIGMAPVAVAAASPESPSAAGASAVTVEPAGPQVSGAQSRAAAGVADSVAAIPVSPRAGRVSSLLDLLPTPLNCLLSTGYALLCLGVAVP
ncbi:hypothetical protein ACFYU5_00570 [Nocardia aobensis]|uniref:Uncharacterized protein n=1 Tax=Nocardia aobensis TaxID=257277 RepID=A0ABW6NV25_9NOCA